MSKSASNKIERGQTIAFRVPSDTPDHVLKQLQRLKETERRNFSSKIAEFVMQGVGQTLTRERETVTIPLPQKLSKIQRDWLKHEHSEALLGSIMYQLLSDPVRAASLLASLNSNSTDINQALYLQDVGDIKEISEESSENNIAADHAFNEVAVQQESFEADDDLDSFDWTSAKKDEPAQEEDQEESLDDLLGGFLSKMNK
ncbi:hypothetical protein [Metabacillus arenae]|uniref:Uncharacterized protein n=1 Tax=Metabacillus arenae TaxID=2771434 RepID=A0A926NEQ8_9BACI|nr:hypothetical protein [Metabacillus arenae]MBD1379765.1 hypothetical protein [Metabacillus arenae]